MCYCMCKYEDYHGECILGGKNIPSDANCYYDDGEKDKEEISIEDEDRIIENSSSICKMISRK